MWIFIRLLYFLNSHDLLTEDREWIRYQIMLSRDWAQLFRIWQQLKHISAARQTQQGQSSLWMPHTQIRPYIATHLTGFIVFMVLFTHYCLYERLSLCVNPEVLFKSLKHILWFCIHMCRIVNIYLMNAWFCFVDAWLLCLHCHWSLLNILLDVPAHPLPTLGFCSLSLQKLQECFHAFVPKVDLVVSECM